MDIKLIYIALATCFFSFGIQTLFYLWYLIRREPIIGRYKTVFSYYSGVVGDAILIPATNVFAFLTLEGVEFPLADYPSWLAAFVIGLTTTLLIHFVQKHLNLTNWTMPQKGKWTFLGIYHTLFMFVETIFLSFTLLTFVRQILTEGKSLGASYVRSGLFIMFLFLLTFVYDYWSSLFKKVFTRVRAVYAK